MKKMTYVIVFCLGVFLTCVFNNISLIKSASAENLGKQKLLYSMADRLSLACDGRIIRDAGTHCLDFYQYCVKLGGTNELIYYAREQHEKK